MHQTILLLFLHHNLFTFLIIYHQFFFCTSSIIQFLYIYTICQNLFCEWFVILFVFLYALYPLYLYTIWWMRHVLCITMSRIFLVCIVFCFGSFLYDVMTIDRFLHGVDLMIYMKIKRWINQFGMVCWGYGSKTQLR